MGDYEYAGTGTEDRSPSPVDIAQRHCAGLDHTDQVRFMAEFGQARAAELKGRDTYPHWKAIRDDPTLMAGYLEGVASARRMGARL